VSRLRGAAAEQFVIARALQRGYRVAVPIVDMAGIDLYFVNQRNEILGAQIKMAQRQRGAWRIKLRNGADQRYGDAVDLFVAVDPDLARIWLVPAVALAHAQHKGALRPRWLERWGVIDSFGAFRGRAKA
jgi:hypothetical protein